MKRAVVVGLIGMVLFGMGAMAGPALEPGPGRQPFAWQAWEIALGSSFVSGNPAFDVWLQWNVIPRALGLRVSSSLLTVTPTSSQFLFTGGVVGQPYIADIGLQLGVGAGAFVSVSGGTVTGQFAAEAMAGLKIPIAPNIGFYAQTRLLGIITGGTLTGNLIPGLGFFILF